MVRLIVCVFSLLLGFASEGCNGQQVPQKTSSESVSVSTTLRAEEVRLRQVNKSGFDEWLRSQKGKVVLVDFWATWCGPCRELFPHTVQVYRQWAPKGLVVASVSLDDPDSESVVRQFLAQQGAAFENFLAVGPPEPFQAFQITGGAIPHMKIYGPDGKLFRELGSDQQGIEPTDIDKAVQAALASLSNATISSQ